MATTCATGVRRNPRTHDIGPLGPLVMLQEEAREKTACSPLRKLGPSTEFCNILQTRSTYFKVETKPLHNGQDLRDYVMTGQNVRPSG